ncbi:MAG: hypothetical protein NTZ72_17460, partial [Afipia sp.]|nr:hypothetical protein [Afipia sp.]
RELDMANPIGRPKKVDYDFAQHIWVLVESLRVKLSRSGKPASVRRVAIYLADHGGIGKAVGGLKEGGSTPEEMSALRASLMYLNFSETKAVVAFWGTYLVSDARRIRNIYLEAKKWTEDPEILFAWQNMVRDLTGQPRVPPRMQFPARFSAP